MPTQKSKFLENIYIFIDYFFTFIRPYRTKSLSLPKIFLLLTIKCRDYGKQKTTKKSVNYIIGELFTECLVNSMFIPGTDQEKANALMNKILQAQDEFIGRISHTETWKRKKIL